MSKEFESIKQRFVDGRPVLIVLVGESGAGKSTLCKLINLPDIWYSSSGAIVKRLNQEGIPISHDSIHKFANDAYSKNPEWQVPEILASVIEKRTLILDGPRRIKEVQALRKKDINMVVIKITASEQERFRRLQSRDGIDREDFERILRDESQETELGQLLSMSDIVIENNGSLYDIETKAQEIRNFINFIKEK